MFSATIEFDVLARGANTNKLRNKLLHVGDVVLACNQVKGFPRTPMSAKNTSVALSDGKLYFAARHHDAVMVTEASMMVRVVVHEVSRGIEIFCANAGIFAVVLSREVRVAAVSAKFLTKRW